MMNSKQKFAVRSITRFDIATHFNTFLTLCRWDDTIVNEFKPDDERLTDKFCQSYADDLGKLYHEVASDLMANQIHHRKQQEFVRNKLKSLFGKEFKKFMVRVTSSEI